MCAWQLFGASVRGAAHGQLDQDCQDSHEIHLLPGNCALLAAADGSGSAARAREAAQVAVNAVCTAVKQAAAANPLTILNAEDALKQAVRFAHESVLSAARDSGEAPRDYGTTLIMVIVNPSWFAMAQIGDGAAVIRDANGVYRNLSPLSEHEYINETVFLHTGTPPFVCKGDSEVTMAAVFTDGLQRLALCYPGGHPHPPFFEPIYRFAHQSKSDEACSEAVRSLLQSDRVAQRAEDDVTLVIAALSRSEPV